MSRFHLILFVHAHQPIGNFDEVMDRAYERCYFPFLESLGKHPSIRVALHFSGPLLEWFEQKHPEFFLRLRGLVARGQVELLGGGFYEPILIAIPPEDQLEQLRRMSDYLEKRFGQRPQGAWLAERVWEPNLPRPLAEAGVAYTLVDDLHFLAAGFQPHELHGYYVAEDCGKKVDVFPGLKALRYLIPFRSVEETLAFLRQAASESPEGLAAFGDDCEKFGVWPGTYEHCYRDGWLERFLSALEANSDWLETMLPAAYRATQRPLGRADLPAASYPEMMEWALPTPARERFAALEREFALRPDVQAFLRGGIWRGFLGKYPEANLLHKKMLYVSERIQRQSRRRGPSWGAKRKLAAATTHLLRAQCNDAYWHGIFGGLYAPHLRAAVWKELIRAEALADSLWQPRKNYASVARLDFDADGAEELYLTAPQFAALIKPSDGGTLAALDFRPVGVPLINSLQRGREAYHARLAEATRHNPAGVASIHEQTRVAEEGLERYLRYDRWPRHAFRLLLFHPRKSFEDYQGVHLEEDPTFAGNAYQVVSARPEKVSLVCEGALVGPMAPVPEGFRMSVAKSFFFSQTGQGFEVRCEIELSHRDVVPGKLAVGLEVVANLLAGNEPDRYFRVGSERHPLGWGGTLPGSELHIVDEWQGVGITLEAPGANQFWITPIETVSESEQGFERVYQGSQILPLWLVELGAGPTWTGQATLRATSLG